MKLLRTLLFPFSLIYGVVVIIRNFLYDAGVFKSRVFNHPVIAVGNLAVGGSGKSPVTEYLVRHFDQKYKVATLSRGYGRKTKGYLEVLLTHLVADAGDEPLQFKHKFPHITVAVCEKREKGIEQLIGKSDVIIMDDAYQHRAVKPGLSILLFDYTRVDDWQFMLPAGDLREPLSGIKRSDVILITKTPPIISNEEKKRIATRLKAESDKPLFFSLLMYGKLVSLHDRSLLDLSELNSSTSVLLLTGIANTIPLMEKLNGITNRIIHHKYPDHHTFSTKNIIKLADTFKQIKSNDRLIITTEKDAQRLMLPELQKLIAGLPVYYLPVSVKIDEEEQFKAIIDANVTKYTSYH